MKKKDVKFKDVKGFEDFYKVSNKGGILIRKEMFLLDKNGRERKFKERRIKGSVQKGGYRVVGLSNITGVVSRKPLKHVVAETWLKNPNNYKSVKVLDGDETNLNVENLKYFHRSETMSEAFKKNAEGVEIVMLGPATGKITVFNSFSHAERNGYDKRKIQAYMKTGMETYKGCKFMLKEEFDKRLEAMNAGQN